MSKFESLNTVMSLSEAKEYLEEFNKDLDTIYLSEGAPSAQQVLSGDNFWGTLVRSHH